MSAYTKTTWVNGSAPGISAENLNHIEDGIYTAHQEIAALDGIDTVSNTWTNLSFTASETKTLTLSVAATRRMAIVTITATVGTSPSYSGYAGAMCSTDAAKTMRVVAPKIYTNTQVTYLSNGNSTYTIVADSLSDPKTSFALKGVWIDQANGQVKVEIQNQSTTEVGSPAAGTLNALTVTVQAI